MEKTVVAPLSQNDISSFPHTHWNSLPWQEIPSISLNYHMGNPPQHRPATSIKLGYSKEALHLIFRVADNYIRATASNHQEAVCQDSCVEFFFTPGDTIAAGYFNLEINCGGILLFHYHPQGQRDGIELPLTACNRIQIAHTLPRHIEEEICTPTTWLIACTIPFSLLHEYSPVVCPQRGTIWRANFYKCADQCSHPHWLTWSPVTFSRPNFHLPAYFGILKFL